MALTAQELSKKIQNKKSIIEASTLKELKARCVAATTLMISSGQFSTEVNLNDEDLDVLDVVTQEMRKLNYRFCLIEVQNEKDEIISHRLRISVAHLRK